NDASLMKAQFPVADPKFINPAVEEELTFIMKIVEAVRNIRGELGMSPSQHINVHLYFHGAFAEKLAIRTEYTQGLLHYIERLCRATTIPTWASEATTFVKPKSSASAVVEGVEIYIPLEGILDIDAERKRLEKEIQRLESLLEGTKQKLANQNFTQKAPAAVVQKEREKKESIINNIEKLKANLAALS
ncbi:MAG: hypothetical protein KBG83_03520, partial [Bacteroidetes bacterium]|nr:hypothetical protein [Bacteroidota bacterium]